MDFGDPRESLVSLNTPGTWEADNRVEERWQWGAQLLDLCNLSPEDYKNSTAVTVKTIQNCGECGGGGGGTVSDNKGTATVSGEGKIKVSFDKPVNSQLYLFITFKDGNADEYTASMSMANGTSTAETDISSISPYSPYVITDIKVGFKEDGSDAGETAKDDKYEYSVSYESGPVGKTYAISILCTVTDSLTGDDYAAIINSQGVGFDYVASYSEIDFGDETTAEATFYVPCSYEPSIQTETPEEEEYFENNSYDFVILTQSEILKIENGIADDKANWAEDSIAIDGHSFETFTRRDLTGAQCGYSNVGECDGDDIIYAIEIRG